MFALRCVPITCFRNTIITKLFLSLNPRPRGQDALHSWCEDVPGTAGQLRLHYAMLNLNPSTSSMESFRHTRKLHSGLNTDSPKRCTLEHGEETNKLT
jgi:hypothetical protein